MFDTVSIKQELPLPEEIKNKFDWWNHPFQTKDLDNCMSEYIINEYSELVEVVTEREYIPYSEEEIANAQVAMDVQGKEIEDNLHQDPDFAKNYADDKKYAKENGEEFVEMKNREIVAIIAYIQRLGTDIKVKDEQKTDKN